MKYSDTASEKDELKEYYDTLRECKYSQHCCTLLKKKPSEKIQAELDCDVIIKGLMAAESHTRMVNVATRGHIFASHRPHVKDGSFYHVSPIAMWTDDDIWEYIHKYDVEYSSLYDITYTDKSGEEKYIKRNGCMFCGTDIQFKDNHLSVLRQTHPKAYRVCMDQYGYKHELNKLFEMKKNQNILAATTDLGRTARMIDAAGEQLTLLDVRPCAYDDFAEMVDLKGTGLDNEYDPDAN